MKAGKIEISLFKHYADNKPQTATIDVFINDVRTGKYANEINAIRAANEIERKELKKKLPSVTVSGTFNNGHASKNLIEHSGFICIDFDNITDLQSVCTSIYADKHTFCGFVSCSGTGIAIIVKITPEADKHKLTFNQLSSYYRSKYGIEADKKCSDVGRLRFTSYDPEIYVNYDSKVFTPEPAKEAVKSKKTPIKTDVSTAYGLKILERLINDVSTAPVGTRNTVLTEAARRFGQLVAGGELSEGVAWQIKNAAQSAGLETKEINACFYSAFNYGLKFPTSAPDHSKPYVIFPISLLDVPFYDIETIIKNAYSYSIQTSERVPMVAVETKLLDEFLNTCKSEFDIICFRFYCSIKSYLGRSQSRIVAKKSILFRAFPNDTERQTYFSKRRKFDKVMVELENWGLTRGSEKGTRGIIITNKELKTQKVKKHHNFVHL